MKLNRMQSGGNNNGYTLILKDPKTVETPDGYAIEGEKVHGTDAGKKYQVTITRQDIDPDNYKNAEFVGIEGFRRAREDEESQVVMGEARWTSVFKPNMRSLASGDFKETHNYLSNVSTILRVSKVDGSFSSTAGLVNFKQHGRKLGTTDTTAELKAFVSEKIKLSGELGQYGGIYVFAHGMDEGEHVTVAGRLSRFSRQQGTDQLVELDPEEMAERIPTLTLGRLTNDGMGITLGDIIDDPSVDIYAVPYEHINVTKTQDGWLDAAGGITNGGTGTIITSAKSFETGEVFNRLDTLSLRVSGNLVRTRPRGKLDETKDYSVTPMSDEALFKRLENNIEGYSQQTSATTSTKEAKAEKAAEPAEPAPAAEASAEPAPVAESPRDKLTVVNTPPKEDEPSLAEEETASASEDGEVDPFEDFGDEPIQSM